LLYAMKVCRFTSSSVPRNFWIGSTQMLHWFLDRMIVSIKVWSSASIDEAISSRVDFPLAQSYETQFQSNWKLILGLVGGEVAVDA
jgi:hypothetical protein